MRIFRRFATTAATLALAVITTVGLAGPAGATTNRATVGHLDVLRAVPAGVYLSGWAFDPQRPAASSTMDVVMDGRMAALPWANLPRADINRRFHLTGNHEFRLTIAASPGTHKVCVIARPAANSGGTWSILGCRTVTVRS